MFIGQLDDEQDIVKLNQMLKDEIDKQSIDMERIKYLWRKTFIYRWQYTRNNLINDILSEHPGYTLPALVSCRTLTVYFIQRQQEKDIIVT
jgi:hypothetical protein